MTNIELVIKISEEAYQGIVNANKVRGQWGNDLLGILCAGIANGTPLPKGHGRLIEVNKLLNITKSYKSELGGLKADPFVKIGIETVESFIKELPTIIEADKAESEDLNE